MNAQLIMPTPGKSSSPKFKGKESKILSFIQKYEAAADAANLSDEQRCRQVTMYTSKAIKELWEQLPAFLGNGWNWSTYKAQIIRQYPGIDIDHKHTQATLNRWVHKAHKKKINSLKKYGHHKRSFLRQAGWLSARNQLDSLQMGIIYSKSLPKKLRKRTIRRLQLTNTAHHPKESYSYEELDEAATYVLQLQAVAIDSEEDASEEDSSDSSDSSSGDDSDSEKSDSNEEDRKTRRKKGKKKKKNHRPKSKSRGSTKKHIKKEDNDTLKSLVMQMNQLAVALTQQASVPANTRYTPPASGSNAVPIGNRPFPRGCAFCGENGHFIRECKHCDEFVSQGKLIYTCQGQFAMRTGEPIPFGALGQTMKKQVDDALQQ
jgi:hypothetical protein